MKKNVIILFSATIVLVTLSFTTKNSFNKSNFSDDKCYDFFVKCKGSSQFVETIKAKSMSEAKTIATNRYPQCAVSNKSSHTCK